MGWEVIEDVKSHPVALRHLTQVQIQSDAIQNNKLNFATAVKVQFGQLCGETLCEH